MKQCLIYYFNMEVNSFGEYVFYVPYKNIGDLTKQAEEQMD
ncbi:hypothetical protein [Bacillus cereus]|nr:hypothetical protein [Bacillus cereus]